MKSKFNLLWAVVIIITLISGIYIGVLGISPINPPKNYEEPSQLTEQSLDEALPFTRTMMHVKNMTQQAHPSGTQENKIVREYLVDQIESMGYTAEILPFNIDPYWDFAQTTPIYLKDGSVELENILVRVVSPKSEKGVLFVSHYDSTPYGPGAADDAIAVASMLEAMRSIGSAEELENSLYFLFTDGEEIWLLGAHDFVTTQPEFRDNILFAVNLEARGNNGGVVLFETSDNNYELIKHYKKAVSAPMALSFAVSVYKEMPNGTDFSEFLDAGYKGINFAAIEGAETYHMPSDNFENLNRNMAAHYQDTVQSLVDYAKVTNFDNLSHDTEGVFFPFGRIQVLLTSGASFIISIISISLCAALIIFCFITKKASWWKSLIAVLVPVLSALIAYGIGIVAFYIVKKIIGLDNNQPMYKIVEKCLMWEGSFPTFIITIALVVILSFLLSQLGVKLLGKIELLLGNLLLFCILAGVLQNLFASGSYLIYIPLLLQAILIPVNLWARNSDMRQIVAAISFFIMGIASMGLLAGTIVLLFNALTNMQISLICILAVICASLFIPFYKALPEEPKRYKKYILR